MGEKAPKSYFFYSANVFAAKGFQASRGGNHKCCLKFFEILILTKI